MSSSPVDSATQKASAAATEAAAATQTANAAAAQKTANNQVSTLFGTYDPTTNQYTGGTESANLNPDALKTSDLSGSYASLYKTQADQQAAAAKTAVATANQNAASRGMGMTPNGYTADQERQAYQTQAQNNSANYANDFGNQNAQQVSLYNNANNMLANSANQNQNSATSNNANSNSANTSLYGTSSQQVQSPLAATLGAVATLGGAAIGKIPGCWIVAAIFDGWTDPRTHLVRTWLHTTAPRTLPGRILLALYSRYGERIAARIRISNPLRAFFTPICEEALFRATAWKAAA